MLCRIIKQLISLCLGVGGAVKAHKSSLHAIASILRQEGFFGVYNGLVCLIFLLKYIYYFLFEAELYLSEIIRTGNTSKSGFQKLLSVQSTQELLLVLLSALYVWFTKLMPPSQPIRCKTKTNNRLQLLQLRHTRFPALGAGYVYLLRVLIGTFCCLRLLLLAIVIILLLWF